MNKNRSDDELMSLMAKGEMEPLGELYLKYGQTVRNLLWRILGSESADEAQDICHEVFETIFQTAPRFKLGQELRPWIFGISVRKARSYQRKQWGRRRLMKRYVEESENRQYCNNSQIVTLRQLDRAINALAPLQKEVLILFSANNLSGDEIAKIIGTNLNTVWTRLRRARIALRQSLEMDCDEQKIGAMR